MGINLKRASLCEALFLSRGWFLLKGGLHEIIDRYDVLCVWPCQHLVLFYVVYGLFGECIDSLLEG